jgi:hypothetical protein
MDNFQNCDSYVDRISSQTYRSDFQWFILYTCTSAALRYVDEFWLTYTLETLNP